MTTTTATTEDIESALLAALSTDTAAVIDDSYPWSQTQQLDHLKVIGVIKSLSADGYVVTRDLQTSFCQVTEAGRQVLQEGSQEYRVLSAVLAQGSSGVPMGELANLVGKDVSKIGMAQCMKERWLTKEGANLVPTVTSLDQVQDGARADLQRLTERSGALDALPSKTTANLKKRKFIKEKVIKSVQVQRGPSYAPQRVKKAADLTKEMLDSGAWKTTPFKPYNLVTLGEPVRGGYLHPLLKVRAEFRKILLQMGFGEMPTNKWVESSFWNFDSLFQPQSHPARDAHDTFFIQEPAATVAVPEPYYEKVKATHETGGTSGSIGYRYDFQREEAMKNLLRTHTTAVSSQMLYKLANQEGGFKPQRYFSIDRVFRNETMDATHLCEFHQVEGLVADYDLSLGDLIGTIETFFQKIGITQLRFKPAFNPYTEPSMEIFGYHPDLKKWTEIGNSGMFRPEMLEPMGLPENVRVIAWGLSLERPTMIKYRIKNIRDLFGHKVEMGRTRTAPICRFDDASQVY